MSTVENYIPFEGIMAFSNAGYQRVTSTYDGGFNYRSRIGSDFLPTNRNSIDSCWETGNIYYIENGDVYKIQYDGTAITSLDTDDAVSIATSQALLPMEREIVNFREDNGCWIVRNTLKKLVKTDNALTVVSELTALSDPKLVVSSDVDSGCYLFDDGLQWVMKVNESAEVTAYIPYASISGDLTAASLVKRSGVDHEGNLWILIDRFIYKVLLSDDILLRVLILDPLSFLGYTQYNSYVSDFDIDRNSSTANLYVTGGCKNRAWIMKYNLRGDIINFTNGMGIEHPVAIKVTQYSGSNGLYIITEDDSQYLPIECETSSSSSEEYSSSSSTSTSSSSLGLPCCDRWEIYLPNPTEDSIFPIWDIYGMTTFYFSSCRVWAEFTSSGIAPVTQTINLYDSPIKVIDNLVATGSKNSDVTGDITLSEIASSGVTGSVEWYESPPGTHPNTLNYPNSLFELTCAESSSSSSSQSSSSESSESSLGYSSSSSSSAQIYDCEILVCETPTGGSANACSVFSDWTINGTTNLNTKQGSMVVQIYHSGAPSESPPSTYRFDIYNADEINGTPIGSLVATSGDFTWSELLPYDITFNEVSGSNIDGQVTWNGYTGSSINEYYTLITCPEELSSSSSSTSSSSSSSEPEPPVFRGVSFTDSELNGGYYFVGIDPYYPYQPIYDNDNGARLQATVEGRVYRYRIYYLTVTYVMGSPLFILGGYYKTGGGGIGNIETY